eukprot:6482244-Amphidinium_carterae.2
MYSLQDAALVRLWDLPGYPHWPAGEQEVISNGDESQRSNPCPLPSLILRNYARVREATIIHEAILDV